MTIEAEEEVVQEGMYRKQYAMKGEREKTRNVLNREEDGRVKGGEERGINNSKDAGKEHRETNYFIIFLKGTYTKFLLWQILAIYINLVASRHVVSEAVWKQYQEHWATLSKRFKLMASKVAVYFNTLILDHKAGNVSLKAFSDQFHSNLPNNLYHIRKRNFKRSDRFFFPKII